MNDADAKSSSPEEQQRAAVRTPAYVHRKSEEIKHPPAQFNQAGCLFVFFGVLLPVCLITTEATTHVCAQSYFDPLPTFGYLLLVSLIPLSNALFWIACRRNMTDNYAFMTLASGMAAGVGIMYSLMLLPCAISAFFVAFAATLLTLPCSLKAGRGVCSLADIGKTSFDAHQTKHFGHLLILVAVVAMELPSTLTRLHLAAATNTDSSVSTDAIKWLRACGNQEVMLRACYEHSGRATDIVGTLYESQHPIAVQSARNVFYKVTGKPFNSVPIPSDMRATMQHAGLIGGDSLASTMNAGVTDEFDLDPDIAGENVSGVARGLSVSLSEISANVNNELAVADMQWTFTVQNSAEVDREARAKILLPADAVVDYASIKVNGQTRQAQIAPRSQAREYYRSSVMQKRDPLLLSASGTDEVLVQCYPVNANNKMEVTLGIEAPVRVDPITQKATLSLPAFAERNFQTDGPVKVTIEGTDQVSLLRSDGESSANGASPGAPQLVPTRQVSQTMNLADLSKANPIISVKRSGKETIGFQYGYGVAIKSALAPMYRRPDNLRVVIDGSASMTPYLGQIVEGLRALPASMPVSITLVCDSNQDWHDLTPSSDKFKDALNTLTRTENYAGGQDNVPALQKCLQNSRASADAQPVLWIHAAQPIAPAAPGFFTYNRTKCYDMQVCPGPDSIMDLNPPCLIRVATTGNASDTLKSLFDRWTENEPASQPDQSMTPQLMADSDSRFLLCKLKGKQDVDEALRHSKAGRDSEMATGLATRCHIVTPVTSLVVCDPELVAQKAASAKPVATVQRIAQNSLEPVGFVKHRSVEYQMIDERAMKASGGSSQTEASAKDMEIVAQKQVGGNVFNSMVTQLNGLSSAASPSAQGYSSNGDEFASGGTTGNFSNDSFTKMNTGSQTMAPALQGATNGTIGQEDNRYASTSAGTAGTGFSSWMPQLQQEERKEMLEARMPVNYAETAQGMGSRPSTFWTIFLTILLPLLGIFAVYWCKRTETSGLSKDK